MTDFVTASYVMAKVVSH